MMKKLFSIITLIVLLQSTAISSPVAIQLESAIVCSIHVSLPGLTIQESARLFQMRLMDWYKFNPRPPLQIVVLADSAILFANDQVLWGFGTFESYASGSDPQVLALKTELRLRELVHNKETVAETRDPLAKLMIALIVIPLLVILFMTGWIYLVRFIRASIYKSQSSSDLKTMSRFRKNSIDWIAKIVTILGIIFIVIGAILFWMYLFSTTREVLNFFLPLLGNFLVFSGSVIKWLISFTIVYVGILVILHFLKIRLSEEFEPEVLNQRFTRLQRFGLGFAIILSLPLGVGLPPPIAWALPITTFLVVSIASLPIVRSLIVGILLPLDPTHNDVVIHWKNKDWKLDRLNWINAHIQNQDNEEAIIPLHWFMNDSDTLYFVSRKQTEDVQRSSKS